jgi:uncharacterized membrane protein YqaE (UPF0057 family)
MSTPDPYNIKETDPSQLIYVSKKNWSRKQNIENNNQLNGLFGRPGPISGLVMITIDIIVEISLKFVFYLFDLTQYAFNWINNITFGNFKGIIPTTFGGGKVISTKFFRYTINVFLPPLGIMLSKGMYGWFTILCCILITYINYLAGIVFAFIITARNRYADQYESYQLKQFAENPLYKEEEVDTTAFFSLGGFLLLILSVIVIFLSFF